MNTLSTTVAIIAACVIAALFIWHLVDSVRTMRRRTPPPSVVAIAVPLGSPMPQPGTSSGHTAGWHPIGGSRLELRDTGVQIQLLQRSGFPPYMLFTPEGTARAWGHDLEGLKHIGQAVADERAQFACRGVDVEQVREQLEAIFQRGSSKRTS